jgi:hypothetical protein
MQTTVRLSWEQMADALDRFDGTGLGVGRMRTVVGERNGKPLARYCAVGAIHRTLNPAWDWESHDVWRWVDGFARDEIIEANDQFRADNVHYDYESQRNRRARLDHMRAYLRARARGVAHHDAIDAAQRTQPSVDGRCR